MKFVTIFAGHLWSVRFENEKYDEFNRLMGLWTNTKWLIDFFDQQTPFCRTPFWSPYEQFDTSIKAAGEVRNDALNLQDKLLDLADKSKTNNVRVFMYSNGITLEDEDND